jgi:hypothetical protein
MENMQIFLKISAPYSLMVTSEWTLFRPDPSQWTVPLRERLEMPYYAWAVKVSEAIIMLTEAEGGLPQIYGERGIGTQKGSRYREEYMYFSKIYSGWDLAQWLERLTANAEVATVLGSIPASSDTVESEGRQMKQCWIQYIEKINPKKSPFFLVKYVERKSCEERFEMFKNRKM